MLWDPSFDSWQELGIRGQPAAVLYSADGEVLEGWSGRIPEERVLDLIADPDVDPS